MFWGLRHPQPDQTHHGAVQTTRWQKRIDKTNIQPAKHKVIKNKSLDYTS